MQLDRKWQKLTETDRNWLKNLKILSSKKETGPVRSCFDVSVKFMAIPGHPGPSRAVPASKCQASATRQPRQGIALRCLSGYRSGARGKIGLIKPLKEAFEPFGLDQVGSMKCKTCWFFFRRMSSCSFLDLDFAEILGIHTAELRWLKLLGEGCSRSCESNFQSEKPAFWFFRYRATLPNPTPERFGWRLSTTSLRQYTSQNFACGCIPMASLYCGHSTCTLWNRDELFVHLEAMGEICPYAKKFDSSLAYAPKHLTGRWDMFGKSVALSDAKFTRDAQPQACWEGKCLGQGLACLDILDRYW